MFFVPLGYYLCLVHKITHGKLFLGMYGVFSSYFASAMVRLMLVWSPCGQMLSAIAISHVLRKSGKSIRLFLTGYAKEETKQKTIVKVEDGPGEPSDDD